MQGRVWARGENAAAIQGFSLVETLVVLAILSILMAMLVTSLTKALRMAKATAAGETMRHGGIERSMDEPSPLDNPRAAAREAFRQTVDYGKGETIVSELLFVVQTDDEFRAYWHTLLNPRNSGPVEFSEDGTLMAQKPSGHLFRLPRVGTDRVSGYPIAWEFISTDLSETSRGDLGGMVVYHGGATEYVRYPGPFPMTPAVASLSHRYMELNE